MVEDFAITRNPDNLVNNSRQTWLLANGLLMLEVYLFLKVSSQFIINFFLFSTYEKIFKMMIN